MSRVDPFIIDAENDNRSAQVIQVETLGKGGVAALLLITVASLAFSLIGWGKADRAMDRAALAEREARIAQDEVQRIKVATNTNTDH
jgi:hypothetical protein